MTKEILQCMFPDCPKASFMRGLCNNHYQIACKLVNREKTTWLALEDSKKYLPKGNRSKKSVAEEYFLKP